MDLRWIAGSLDNDSEALEPVLLWIRSESHRKRSGRRRVCLFWPYITCVLVNDFRSFNDATNQRMISGHSFFTCVNPFSLRPVVGAWPPTFLRHNSGMFHLVLLLLFDLSFHFGCPLSLFDCCSCKTC